jgi:hypothetical protein
MTAKEKAKELVWKYLPILESWKEDNSNKAKQCAIIAVDEVMYNNLMEYPQHSMIYNPHKNDYWQEVKREIEKI